jgi:phosphatidylserine decarboxylase
MRFLGIAREGLPLVAAAAILGTALAAAGWKIPAAAAGVFAACCAMFFRDPERAVPEGENTMVSPADGKVVEVTAMENGAHKIGIFLAVWNVHVNRMPAAGEVKNVQYENGEFLAAFHPEAPARNERNRVNVQTAFGEASVTQIAGLVARRIVCRARAGDRMEKGQRFGLIQFGSRVDCVLPPAARVTVRPGQHVRGGETIIGYAGEQESA